MQKKIMWEENHLSNTKCIHMTSYIQMNPGRANKYTRQWKKVWQGGNIWLFEHYFGAQVAHRHVSRCFSTNQLLKCCTPDVFPTQQTSVYRDRWTLGVPTAGTVPLTVSVYGDTWYSLYRSDQIWYLSQALQVMLQLVNFGKNFLQQGTI